MPQKKLMLLGGLRFLLPVIEAAHRLGIYVITVDYIPDNIAHKYSDEYYNVSIIDKEAILDLARKLQIDGIMSFAVDPGVITAAYVQEQMGLPPFGPYESVYILQNKDCFRDFLTRNGFNVPQAKGFSSVDDAWDEMYQFPWPCIVKPVDSAGSKGVTRVDNPDDLRLALEWAWKNSISGRIIVEEFIDKEGCSSDTDCFLVNGVLKFVSFSAQYFDNKAPNPYTPAAYGWPSTFTKEQEAELTSEIQRLLQLLNMNTSIYNIETRVGTNGKSYIMEVSPRGGGNRLAEMLRYATGVDLIKACVQGAIGLPIDDIAQNPYKNFLAEVILHVNGDGVFTGLKIDKDFWEKHKTADGVDLWVKEGEAIRKFNGANDAIGTLALQFDSQEDLRDALAHQDAWLSIGLK